MFGTVIIDAYSKDERQEIADSIDDLCSPKDNYGWASAGIYCFWDYYAEEVLYIGLASDLADRFKQHNGIKPVDGSSSKYAKIEEYFESNERLGYTIFVQSPLSQPLTYRNKATYKKFAEQLHSPVEDIVERHFTASENDRLFSEEKRNKLQFHTYKDTILTMKQHNVASLSNG
ncbi:hypothetical protein [Alkaliphilus serpentinus]|uniref:hypothetical protein n=1 Tax=Alkaliphilus serpentinus TaxID=1482731 RepID=UPI001FAADEFF|nr:hypothetical protein [Alkaliphilus serpentinus]